MRRRRDSLVPGGPKGNFGNGLGSGEFNGYGCGGYTREYLSGDGGTKTDDFWYDPEPR